MNISTSSPDCSDIYKDEFDKWLCDMAKDKELHWLRSTYSRELWLQANCTWFDTIFQYADPDFYYHRLSIEQAEKKTSCLLIGILCRVMIRYGLDFEMPGTIFDFILHNTNIKEGIIISDFDPDDDFNSILLSCGVDEAVIIRTYIPERSERRIFMENKQYHAKGHKLRSITLESFFLEHFGENEYICFSAALDCYLKEAHKIIGFKSIPFLSPMNYGAQKEAEEKILANWQYKSTKYQLIDSNNPDVKDYLYFIDESIPQDDLVAIEKNYLSNGLYRSMIGNNDYAASFLTSEWLYFSLRGKTNFDYTAVISGYLKSIEQLLRKIVLLNVDNGFTITMSRNKVVKRKAKRKNIKIYQKGDYSYIDLISSQIDYIDSSIGSFEYFLRNNKRIFANQQSSEFITDMVCCFRKECRNGYFHIHNLEDWNVVEKTRSNAIFLYFVLLGGCIIPDDKIVDLGIDNIDNFDILCKKIRASHPYAFIFEYADGKKDNLIYDSFRNAISFSDNGIEHYEYLLFYRVKEFFPDLSHLFQNVEEQRVVLTRDNVPIRIFRVNMDGSLEEIKTICP